MKRTFLFFKIVMLSLVLLSCQDFSSGSNFQLALDQPNLETKKIRVEDMLIEEGFISQAHESGDVNVQSAGGYSVYGSQPWKKGVMPIAFSASVTKSKKQWLLDVAQKWSVSTGVSIVLRTGQTDYLYVQDTESGCFSDVGARAGQIRTLNLSATCWTEPIALHELGHALGLMHEHQRPDRNSFISINLNNVDSSLHYAFQLFSTMNNETPYDFHSIMHYGQYAFSKNGQRTMNVLPQFAEYQNVIGIKKISTQDRKSIAAMYAREKISH